MKSQIIERLGRTDILLPSLIAEGLAANDRVKVRLSVLQAAGRHAREPLGVHFDLAGECRTAGIDPLAMETLVNGAGLLAGERITAPGLGALEQAIWDDVAIMVRAVKAADASEGEKVSRVFPRSSRRFCRRRPTPSSSPISRGSPEFPAARATACIAW